MQKPGTLFVVATPIGNLEDLSPRARGILDSVDLIAAEDTRHTGRLLSRFGIKTPQFPLHEHNENEVIKKLLARLEGGESVALVSDAGTPLVSDPGFRMVQAAHQQTIPVSPVAGPCAAISALSVAGLPSDRFCFEGFLPAKSTARRKRLQQLQKETRTILLFESVHRVASCIADIAAILGEDRVAFVAREMSKMHEQCVRQTLGVLHEMFLDGSIPTKGEFVILVEGAQGQQSDDDKIDINQLLKELSEVMPGKQVVAVASRITGRKRNDLYRLMLETLPSQQK